MNTFDVYRIDDAYNNEIKRLTKDAMHEYGGIFMIDKNNKVLRKGKQTGGDTYDAIEMHRGLVEFHTHPTPCKNNKVCTVPIPSPEDMVNIVIGILCGVQCHLLYSSDGVYCISMQEDELNAATLSWDHLKLYIHILYDALDKMHSEFTKHNPGMTRYRDVWLNTCREKGFRITCFKHNEIIRLAIDTNDTQHKAIPFINIPKQYMSLIPKKA